MEVAPDPPAPIEAGVVIRGLRKLYGDTVALDSLDIDARPGEILGVAGANGAGKSTMIKILAGEVEATSGSITIDGEPWSPSFGADRVAVVHQEPQLFPNLTVAENICVGREGTRFVRRGSTEAERAVMADLAILDVADRMLEHVPLAIQQRTEIARALVRDARVFLFDEPNSALTSDESDDLFRRIHALAQRGRVVMLVSHRLAELVAHADRVAVITDGRCTTVLQGRTLTQEAIARELVVGQAKHETVAPARAEVDGKTVLELTGWSHQGDEFREVDLRVQVGEIVAVVGVEGSGARELVRSIAGFEKGAGAVVVDDRQGVEVLRAKSGFVAAERSTSLFPNLSVGDNIVVRLDGEITGRFGALRRGRMARLGAQIRERFGVKARSIGHPIRSLSGGNQQKVAIAAAMVGRPLILVLEEPSRGVDIGSKAEIYRLLREYAREGHAIVMYCTETTEVFDVADRVHVLSDGRLSDQLLVMTYADVGSLAADVSALERHTQRQPSAAASTRATA